MGKHFSGGELDLMHKLKGQGLAVNDIHRHLCTVRSRRGMGCPDVTSVRRALKGKTFKRGTVETRGGPRALTLRNLRALDQARKRLIAKADGEYEVHWDDIIKAARVPKVDRTTAAKAMKAAGYDAQWRTPRLKPARGTADDAQRAEICKKLRMLPETYWTETVDAYIDCKNWKIPRSVKWRSFLNKLKVRGHLRTRREGLERGFTKPDKRKHHRNTGPNAKVFAAIIGGRVRVWHYLPKRWGGDVAEGVYRNVLAPALKRHRGEKRRYILLEDNDPTGFKASIAMAAKAAMKIQPIAFPTYSPDLNPLDYALWQEVENRMGRQQAPAGETIGGFKARLSRTAKSIPTRVVTKMLASMRGRTQSVYACGGGHIPRD